MLTCRISTYVHMVISSTQKRSVVWLRLVRTAAPATLPRLLSEQPNMKPPAIQQKKSPLRWTHKWTSHSKRCFSEAAIKRSRLLSQTASSSTRSKSAWILNRVTAKKIRTSHGHTNLTAAGRGGVHLKSIWLGFETFFYWQISRYFCIIIFKNINYCPQVTVFHIGNRGAQLSVGCPNAQRTIKAQSPSSLVSQDTTRSLSTAAKLPDIVPIKI